MSARNGRKGRKIEEASSEVVTDFILSHYGWLMTLSQQFYRKDFDLQRYSDEDAVFSEILRVLPRILHKFEGQCNLRVFVQLRLRGYVAKYVETMLRAKLKEIEGTVRYLTVKQSEYKSIEVTTTNEEVDEQ